MAYWRLQSPSKFPAYFHDAMVRGEGVDKLIIARYTEAQIRREAKDFRLFRFCLRHYPGIPAGAAEVTFKHRTKVVWDEGDRTWKLLLTSRRNVLEDIVSMD